MKKILFIILDGAAGRSCKTLEGKTELESSVTPFIDSLFHKSINGLMYVVGPNIAPQSDVAAFALLGYNPFNMPARGIVEAVGAGVDYNEGDVALRCNLCYVKKGKLVTVRLANISSSDGLEIERLLNKGISLDVPFTFKHTEGYRGVLILHKKLSDQVTNTHPGYIRERIGEELISVAKELNAGTIIKECRPLVPQASETARLINDFTEQASEILSKLGIKDSRGNIANYMLTRDAGNKMPKMPSFKQVHGINFSLIAEMPVELGVAKLLGLKTVKPSDNLKKLAEQVINETNNSQGVYIHIKGPDKYGHLGDATGKVREIEKIDKEFIKTLLDLVDLDKFTICVTADHATPACLGVHTSDPVPYLITNGDKNNSHFCESNVVKSFIEGRDLMKKVINTARLS